MTASRIRVWNKWQSRDPWQRQKQQPSGLECQVESVGETGAEAQANGSGSNAEKPDFVLCTHPWPAANVGSPSASGWLVSCNEHLGHTSRA